MAKVAIDIRLIGNQRTGDEAVFFELTKALIQEHPEHQYVLLTDKKGEELVHVQERLGIAAAKAEVEVVSFGPQNRFVWNAVTMPLFLGKRKDIEVFHTQYILPFFVPNRIKVVAHIHDVSFARYPEYIGGKDLFFLRLFIPHTMKRAVLAVPSEFTKAEVMDVYKVAADRVVVIPNAPGEAFVEKVQQVSLESLNVVQAKYQLPAKYLLYVGTLQPRKNIPYLLEIFHEYGQKFSDTKLVLVGNRNAHHFDAQIDETLKRLGLEDKVVTPGYIEDEDLPNVYKGAQAFVFPSLYEGFGIPLLEALAAGIPTFASDIPVHHEVGGERVTYFPLGNVAKAAQILYTMPITEAVHPDTRQYSWNISACLLADWYQKMSH